LRTASVDGHHHRHAEAPRVLDVLGQVAAALLQQRDVLFQVGLVQRPAGADLGAAAVHLQRPDRGHDHDAVGHQTRGAALDVEELLHAAVRAEAALGNDVIGQLQGDAVGDDRAVALGDVRERPGVHESRGVLQGLHEVGLDRIAHQHGHGPGGLEVLGGDGIAVLVLGHYDPRETLAQVGQVLAERQDGHDLAGHADVEAGLADAAALTAQAADYVINTPLVVQVDDPAPADGLGIDLQLVAVLYVGVDHGCEQVVGDAHRVDVAGQVEVEVLHGNDLAVAAAGRAALDAEDRPQGGLADAGEDVLADVPQALRQADGGDRLALAQRGGVDGGHVAWSCRTSPARRRGCRPSRRSRVSA
jgi:hypothetical protein